MKRKYINTLLFITLIILALFILILCFSESVLIITMGSIMIPIAITFLIEYDLKQKELLQNFYFPLFLYIRTYVDILNDNEERLQLGEKHNLIDKISEDIYNFLYNNANNISDNLEPIFNIQFFYRYYNNKNKFQRNYNLIKLAPIIIHEYIELYSLMHIEQFFKLRIKFNTLTLTHLKLLHTTYVQCFILEISRRNGYISSIYETIKLQEQTLNNNDITFKYTTIYKDIINNLKNLNNQEDYKKLEAFLSKKYIINFKLPKLEKI